MIKWHEEGGWYIEPSEDIECETFKWPTSEKFGWVLTSLKEKDTKVYFKPWLFVVILGYKELWEVNPSTNIATRSIHYAVVTAHTKHKQLPYVVITTESYYCPLLLRELQRAKRKLDFFRHLESEKAWHALIHNEEIQYTFCENTRPIWAYWFKLDAVVTRVQRRGLTAVPCVTRFGDIAQNDWKLYESAANVAKQHNFITELPQEHRKGIIDYELPDFCSFAAFKVNR